MAAVPIKDAEANCHTVYGLSNRADFPQAVQEFYDKWAEHYDEDLKNANYRAPAAAAEALCKLLDDKNAPIIDCAAGTGLTGQELAKRGFKIIDAVDFSQNSLDISASKGVYRKLICDSIGKNKLKGVEDGSYSGLTCVGSMSTGHISEDAFVEWTRIVKKGGFMVVTLRKTTFDYQTQEWKEVNNDLRDAISDLVQRGVVKLVEQVDISYLYEYVADMYTFQRP